MHFQRVRSGVGGLELSKVGHIRYIYLCLDMVNIIILFDILNRSITLEFVVNVYERNQVSMPSLANGDHLTVILSTKHFKFNPKVEPPDFLNIRISYTFTLMQS